jgi:signal peptidase II
MSEPVSAELSAPSAPPKPVAVPWGFMLGLAAGLYALDQATKWAIVANLEHRQYIPVIGDDFFGLTLVYNTGMAWGLGQGNNGLFIALCVATLVALVFLTAKGNFVCGWTRTGVALLMAGVSGNLTDRIIHGYVIDFLDFTFSWGDWRYAYPTFNVADICIVTAAFLFIVGSFFTSGEEKEKAVEEIS